MKTHRGQKGEIVVFKERKRGRGWGGGGKGSKEKNARRTRKKEPFERGGGGGPGPPWEKHGGGQLRRTSAENEGIRETASGGSGARV